MKGQSYVLLDGQSHPELPKPTETAEKTSGEKQSFYKTYFPSQEKKLW